MWRVIAAVTLGLALAAFLLVDVLTERKPHIAGTNSRVQVSGAAIPVPPLRERCYSERVPAGASNVVLYAGTFGRRGQPVALTVSEGARRVNAGRYRGGYPDNTILHVPLLRTTSRLDRAQVCVRNLGDRRIQFAGNRTPKNGPRTDGEEAIRLDWQLPGRPSWIAIAPKVASRFAATKPTFVGPWTLWVLGALVAGLSAAGIALVIREARR